MGAPIEGATLALLLKVLENICKFPDQPKYRQLKTSNKKFSTLWQDHDIQQLLLRLGFTAKAGIVTLLPTNTDSDSVSTSVSVSDEGRTASATATATASVASSTVLDGGQQFMLASAVEQLQQVMLARIQHVERSLEHQQAQGENNRNNHPGIAIQVRAKTTTNAYIPLCQIFFFL